MSGYSEAQGTAGGDSLADWKDPAAAPESDEAEGEVSQGASGQISDVEPLGGADAVPETPDNVPADQDLGIRDTAVGKPLTENGYGGSSASDG